MSIAENLEGTYILLDTVLADCNEALTNKGQSAAESLGGIAPLISKIATGTEFKLTVTAPEGSELSVGDGGTLFVVFVDESGKYTFDLPRGGEWTITARLNGQSRENTINIVDNYVVTVPSISSILDEND